MIFMVPLLSNHLGNLWVFFVKFTNRYFCTSAFSHMTMIRKKKCLTKWLKLSRVKVERAFVPSPLGVAGLKHALARFNPNIAFQRDQGCL